MNEKQHRVAHLLELEFRKIEKQDKDVDLLMLII